MIVFGGQTPHLTQVLGVLRLLGGSGNARHKFVEVLQLGRERADKPYTVDELKKIADDVADEALKMLTSS